ncbi:hypothetical protein, partial [Burkholderia pseudomallei]|uniref:hypothetical protein n=1 Tax=Burkholderia pseudomallei TaxID=28450 RepID=UPI0019553095
SRRHVTFFSNRPRALNHYTLALALALALALTDYNADPPRRPAWPHGVAPPRRAPLRAAARMKKAPRLAP